MSRSLTPKKEERSAATSDTRSEGSSIARSTASTSCTSWRSKKDLPPSTVKRRPARLERLLEAPRRCVSRRDQHHHVAGPAGRSAPLSGSRNASGCRARSSATKAASAAASAAQQLVAARRRPARRSAARSTAGLVRAAPVAARSPRSPAGPASVGGLISSANTRFTKRRIAGRERKFWDEMQDGRCRARREPAAVRRAEQSAPRRGGSGRSTAWRRRPPPGRPGARASAAARSRPAAGRCPGTRR